MAKRKKRRDSPMFAFSIGHLPKPLPKRQVFETLIKALKTENGELPQGWIVNWRWRNARAKGHERAYREDSFENVVKNSRSAYLTLMERRLKRELAKLPPVHKRRKRAKRKKRKPTRGKLSKVRTRKAKARGRRRRRKAR